MKWPRISFKRLGYFFGFLSLIWLFLMIWGIASTPFNISPHKPTVGYKYAVGDIEVGTWMRYSYTYHPTIEFVDVLIIDKSLTSISCNVTTFYRNGNIVEQYQVWYVGDHEFINDTDIPVTTHQTPIYERRGGINEFDYDARVVGYENYSVPITTPHFSEYAFIAGNLDLNDQTAHDGGLRLTNQRLQIWKIGYRKIIRYAYYGLGEHAVFSWDKKTGVLLNVDIYTERIVLKIDLVDTNLFKTNWLNPFTYLTFYHFIAIWIWTYIVYTKPFVSVVILWIMGFVVTWGWDKSQRGGWGSGMKRWAPLLCVFVLASIIMVFVQQLLMGGIRFFGR